MRTCTSVFIAALAVRAVASAQTLHTGDIGLVIDEESGRIVTGQIVDNVVEPDRLFTMTLVPQGELDLPLTDVVGFDSPVGTFRGGTALTFRFLDALRVWDGEDFDTISPERLGVEFGTQLGFSPPDADTAQTAVVMGVGGSAGSGSFHHHPFYALVLDPDGALLPGAQGLYLMQFELVSSDAAVEASEPFYVLFDHAAEPEQRDAATAFLEALLTPPCFGDIHRTGASEGRVDAADLADLLNTWGLTDVPADLVDPPGVDAADLANLLNAWGPCE